MTTLHIGQKVTPKQDGAWFSWLDGMVEVINDAAGPVFGEVYVIRDIIPSGADDYPGAEVFLMLVEYPGELWDAEEFEPVVEQRTDISMFEQMLKTRVMVR